jgi:hypothetical protein
MTQSAAARDELPPCGEKLNQNPAEMSDCEELAAPVSAGVMMHGNLDEPAALILQLPHHLDADHATIACEQDLPQQTTAKEAEIAVDIPDIKPEQETHEALIEETDDDSVFGIRPADLVPIDNIDPFPEGMPQQRQFCDIILAIPIGIKYQVLGAIRKPGN